MRKDSPRLSLLLLGLTLALPVAAGEIEQLVKHRQNVMAAVGAHMGALSEILRGEVALGDHALVHAEAVAATLTLTPSMFPPGSAVGETRAKPGIWSDWEGFTRATDESVAAAEQLVVLLTEEDIEPGDAGPEIRAALGRLAKSCKSCHKSYRTSRRD